MATRRYQNDKALVVSISGMVWAEPTNLRCIFSVGLFCAGMSLSIAVRPAADGLSFRTKVPMKYSRWVDDSSIYLLVETEIGSIAHRSLFFWILFCAVLSFSTAWGESYDGHWFFAGISCHFHREKTQWTYEDVRRKLKVLIGKAMNYESYLIKIFLLSDWSRWKIRLFTVLIHKTDVGGGRVFVIQNHYRKRHTQKNHNNFWQRVCPWETKPTDYES